MLRQLSKPFHVLIAHQHGFSRFLGDQYGRQIGYVCVITLFTLAAMALIGLGYFAAAFPQENWDQLKAEHYWHVGLALGANLACALLAARLRGTTAARLQAAVAYVLIVHLALIIFLFGFRLYYSRTVMILGLFASLSLVALITALTEIFRPQRVGMMTAGLTPETMAWLGRDVIAIDTRRHRPTDFDIVLVDLTKPLDQAWLTFITQAAMRGCSVRHIPEYIERRSGRVLPEHFEPSHATSEWLNPYTRTVKRVVDITAVVLTLPVVLPIVGVAAFLIRRQMGSPVLFVQDRVGLGGRIFKIYKLRTMTHAPASGPNAATLNGDARITPLGHFLRRHRIDELPQFYNVLRGDMSLVGPRPEQPQLTRRYLESMPTFAYRNMLPPGITGWSQVKAGYAANEAETHEKLMHDLYYVKHSNLLLDLWIMLKTVKAVVMGHGAR